MNLQNEFQWGREIGENLTFNMPVASRTLHSGRKLGRSSGSSLEFRDYREYMPGDDIRRIDWRAYARTDKYMLKLYQEEIEPLLTVISDTSFSMWEPHSSKIQASTISAGIILASAIFADCSVSWFAFGDNFRQIWQRSRSFPEKLPQLQKGSETLLDIFSSQDEQSLQRGLRIVISDFLWDIRPEDIIAHLTKSASPAEFFCIISKEELNPPINGVLTLCDSESGEKLNIEIGAREIEDYKKRLSSHLDLWRESCAKSGIGFNLLIAENIIEGDISALLHSGIISP